MSRNNVPLLTREEIIRRLVRMTGAPHVRRGHEITKLDLAKWFGVEERLVRLHRSGKQNINDFWQVAYSEFFALVDSGAVQIQYPEGLKTLVRVPPPSADAPPKKKLLKPFVDLATMRLGFDS